MESENEGAMPITINPKKPKPIMVIGINNIIQFTIDLLMINSNLKQNYPANLLKNPTSHP